jgi:hypothetical protein
MEKECLSAASLFPCNDGGGSLFSKNCLRTFLISIIASSPEAGKDIISYSNPGPKRILYPITITAKKRIWIYILYPLSKKIPALSQFLNNQKPDLVALQLTSPRLFT